MHLERGMLVRWVGRVGHWVCEGAMLLQWWQFSRMALMAAVMPGQNTVLSAHAVIEVTPRCDEWSIVRMYWCSKGTVTIWTLKRRTPYINSVEVWMAGRS